MKKKLTKSSNTAVSVLDQLLAQARRSYRPNEVIIVQKQVMTPLGRCRVAVVISRYGLHFEIGSRRDVNGSFAWPFREQDVALAVALLESYLGDDSSMS